MDYNLLKIKSFRHWDLYLHENQCYLGRMFLSLKGKNVGDQEVDDFLAIQGEIQEEFFQAGNEAKQALKALFNPDKMNYAALSNTSENIHVHLVPRYKASREFAGITFHDGRWGKNYAPYDREFVIEEGVLLQIRDHIRAELK